MSEGDRIALSCRPYLLVLLVEEEGVCEIVLAGRGICRVSMQAADTEDEMEKGKGKGKKKD